MATPLRIEKPLGPSRGSLSHSRPPLLLLLILLS
jgi:hypothetical protein